MAASGKLSELEPEMTTAVRELAEDGGEDFVVELVDRWVRNTHLRLAALSAAIADECADGASAIAHEIKGSSATIGARRFAAMCLELEAAIAVRAFGAAAGQSTRLRENFARVADALAGSLLLETLDPSTSPERPTLR